MIQRNKMVAFLVAMTMIMGLMLTFATGPTFAAEKKYKMIFIVKSLDNPFWDRMRAGAEKAGKDLGIEIKTLAPIKPYNVEEQLRFMEDGITQKVDAICVVPADSKGIVPGIEKANKAGIPVVTPNSKAYGGKVLTWTGAQNQEVGYDIANYAINAIGGKGNVIILEGTPGNQTAIDRAKGFNDAIAEHSGIKLLASQTAKYSRVEGMRVMENLAQRFPDVDLVIAANDEMALGAIEALDAAGRLSKTKVTGFDANNDALKSISEGKMLATGDQRPDAQGYWGVVAAYCYLEGMPVPKEIYLPAPVIDKSKVAK
ncbi:MAG: sugar ABC transporter substrate-binding protein [Desulfobacterales bacterium]